MTVEEFLELNKEITERINKTFISGLESALLLGQRLVINRNDEYYELEQVPGFRETLYVWRAKNKVQEKTANDYDFSELFENDSQKDNYFWHSGVFQNRR